MANQTYTLSTLQTAVLHALGGAVPDTLTTLEVVNDALQWLANQHSWTWKQRALSLNVTAAQNYVTLPTDFEGLHTVVPASVRRMIPTSLQELLSMRYLGTGLGDIGDLYYSIQVIPQASVTAEPTWKMELYPTPSANATAAIIGVYHRIIPALANSTDKPDIPAQFHHLLKYCCRAHAQSQQYRRDSEDWRIVMDLLPQAIARDGGVMTSLGPIIGATMRAGLREDRGNVVRGTLVP